MAWSHKTHDGLLHSRVFPGLRLPVAPLLAGDTAKVLAALSGHEPPKTSAGSESQPLHDGDLLLAGGKTPV
jgi:hypothetical protein